MNIMKKTKSSMVRDIFALGLSAVILMGATANKKYATIKEATKALGVRPGMIDLNLPDGYKALRADKGNLMTLAGIRAGTVYVEKTEDGYLAEGSYSFAKHPKAMERVLKEADTNEDKIVTPQEVRDLAARLYEKNSK